MMISNFKQKPLVSMVYIELSPQQLNFTIMLHTAEQSFNYYSGIETTLISTFEETFSPNILNLVHMFNNFRLWPTCYSCEQTSLILCRACIIPKYEVSQQNIC